MAGDSFAQERKAHVLGRKHDAASRTGGPGTPGKTRREGNTNGETRGGDVREGEITVRTHEARDGCRMGNPTGT